MVTIGPMGQPEAWTELEGIYADLERELAVLRPLCQRSSRCCRFKEYGHQLWTTGVELDYLVEHEGLPAEGVSDQSQCPYLKDGLCGVRDHRMLGCRIYFCDPGYASAMGPIYEKYHARIKDLHRRHGLAYEYAEFLTALERRVGTNL
jgi:Fe-S-cluster containining protein